MEENKKQSVKGFLNGKQVSFQTIEKAVDYGNCIYDVETTFPGCTTGFIEPWQMSSYGVPLDLLFNNHKQHRFTSEQIRLRLRHQFQTVSSIKQKFIFLRNHLIDFSLTYIEKQTLVKIKEKFKFLDKIIFNLLERKTIIHFCGL